MSIFLQGTMKRLILIILLMFSAHAATLAGNDAPKLISLSPVPITGSRLTVKLTSANSPVNSIELRNLIGRKLQEKKFSPGEEEMYFDELGTYPNGVYVVLVKDVSGKIIETTKFIINK